MSRILMRKRLYDSGDYNNWFDVPIIASLEFKTMQEQAQERFLYFNNSSSSSRVAHWKRVFNAQDPTQFIDVERVDEFHIRDMVSRAQDINYLLVNNDPPPIQISGSNSPAHQKVHYVRYFQNNDVNSENYGDFEVIDELRIKESNGQEWQYFMRNADLGNPIEDPAVPYEVTFGYCDPSLPLAPS